MKLLLDCGNSRIKWALAQGGELLDWGSNESSTLPDHLFAERVDAVLLASVRGDADIDGLIRQAHDLAPVTVLKTEKQCKGLVCAYQEPERLGVDRWLAMLGAWCRLGVGFTLVDAGTAVTIDLVTNDGHHQGGAILPGDQFMVDSLVSGTSGIRPRVDDATPEYPARDTGAAVRAGSRMAVLGAVKEALDHADSIGVSLPLLLTGGGAGWLADALQSHDPLMSQTLVFEGMLEMAPC